MRAAVIAISLASSANAARADTPSGDYREPNIALAWSGLPVLGGIVLLAGGIEANVDGAKSKPFGEPMAIVGAAGILIGPTLGHVYAGHTWSLWLGARVAGLVGMVAGVAEISESWYSKDSSMGCSDCAGATTLTLVSAAVFTIATAGEVITAPSAANDYNRAHHLTIQLAPLPNPAAPGMMVSGTF